MAVSGFDSLPSFSFLLFLSFSLLVFHFLISYFPFLGLLSIRRLTPFASIPIGRSLFAGAIFVVTGG